MGTGSSRDSQGGSVPDTASTGGRDYDKGAAGGNAVIPTIFRWSEPAKTVYVVGSYSNWQNKIALARGDDGVFSATLYLPRGAHEYKFIVDGSWKCAPNQPKVRDKAGNENNWVVVEEVDESVFSVAFDPTSGESVGEGVCADLSQSRRPPHERRTRRPTQARTSF